MSSSHFSDRMFTISRLHMCCIVQKISHRFCNISARCWVQRSLHLIHFNTSGMAEGWHRYVHVVSFNTNMHGTRCHVTRVCYEPRLNIVPKVQLQSGGVHSRLLRQVYAAKFTRVQTCSIFTFK